MVSWLVGWLMMMDLVRMKEIPRKGWLVGWLGTLTVFPEDSLIHWEP